VENMNDSTSIINSVIEEAESKSTSDEPIESKEASFVDQEHVQSSKTTVLDFYGCKGAYMLPYEFRTKEIDDNQQQENIGEQCLSGWCKM
jgi:hypothetical protein